MKSSTLTLGRALVAALMATLSAEPVLAHSWVEQLMRIAPNGTMVGNPGYVRGFIPRGPGWSDNDINYLIPPNDGRSASVKTAIKPTDKLCHPSQAKVGNYPNAQFPKLVAQPGDFIAMRYQENGHVTKTSVNPEKPLNRGTI